MVDDERVYWVEDGGGRILSVTKDGVTLAAIARSASDAVAVDDVSVYFTVGGSVRAIPRAGGAVSTLATAAIIPSGSIAVDGSALYFANAGTGIRPDGSVLRVDKRTGAVTTLAAEQTGPWSVTIDDACAYWTTVDGALMRAPKVRN